MKTTLSVLLLFCSFFSTKAQETSVSKNVSHFSIESPELNKSKKIWLYLPENYKTSKKKYPVIYLHDGQNLFVSKASNSTQWNIDKKLDSLKAQVIVVGIESSGHQDEELSPYPTEKHPEASGEKYTEFLVKTLKPYIDSHYKTKTDAANTTIIGSAVSGVTAMYTVLKYPTVFGKAGIFSPSFWVSDKIYTLAASSPTLNSKIYFLTGNNESEEMVIDLQKMKTTLLENNVISKSNLFVSIVPNGASNQKLWQDGFVGAYLWLQK